MSGRAGGPPHADHSDDTAGDALVKTRIAIGPTELTLHRPRDPESLLNEEAFAHDEFLPYWAELWPAATALADALPPHFDGTRVVELGCGLGLPSLVAAARGARVTATDWAPDAIELLRVNAKANGLHLEAATADWRDLTGRWDLALAADVLYEARNVEPLQRALARVAPRALVALAGRPYEGEFLRAVPHEYLAERVVRIDFDTGQPTQLAGFSTDPT